MSCARHIHNKQNTFENCILQLKYSKQMELRHVQIRYLSYSCLLSLCSIYVCHVLIKSLNFGNGVEESRLELQVNVSA
jgi:hypothetical protein